jgi:hypothetical protein
MNRAHEPVAWRSVLARSSTDPTASIRLDDAVSIGAGVTRKASLMSPNLARIAFLILAMTACCPAIGSAQEKLASWLDEPKPASWNTPGARIPAAPKTQGAIDARCREQARPAQLEEDMRLRDQGWDLVGAYQGGWQMVVIRATASYDGMCRPRQYQDFVFVRGVFAGTLSAQPMDSRSDGALGRVSLQNHGRLSAEYRRYAASDPLCCPSRATTVVFEVANDERPVVRPVSSTTRTLDGSPDGVTSDARRRFVERRRLCQPSQRRSMIGRPLQATRRKRSSGRPMRG